MQLKRGRTRRESPRLTGGARRRCFLTRLRQAPDPEEKLNRVIDERAADGTITQELYEKDLTWRKLIGMASQSLQEGLYEQ